MQSLIFCSDEHKSGASETTTSFNREDDENILYKIYHEIELAVESQNVFDYRLCARRKRGLKKDVVRLLIRIDGVLCHIKVYFKARPIIVRIISLVKGKG